MFAAAGLYALNHHVRRLADDHAHAALLADGLRAQGWQVDPPQTNMVYVEVAPEAVPALQAHLAGAGILASIAEKTRLVTHLDLSRDDVGVVLQEFGTFARGRGT
jgi:threonine aldolase